MSPTLWREIDPNRVHELQRDLIDADVEFTIHSQQGRDPELAAPRRDTAEIVCQDTPEARAIVARYNPQLLPGELDPKDGA